MAEEKLRVLISDDEEMVRLTLTDMLEIAGYQVCGEAVDGIQAIEMTSRLHPDIILMDISMPRMDGIEASRIINATWPTPILFLTAFLDREMVTRAADAGAFAYLIKPCRQGDLSPAIETARSRFQDTQSHRSDAEASRWEMQIVRTLAEEITRGAGAPDVAPMALRYLARGLQVPATALLLRVGNRLRVAADAGLDEEYRRQFSCPLDDPLFGNAMTGSQPQPVATFGSEDLLENPPRSCGACHSILIVPVLRRGTAAGCLVAYRSEPQPFTKEEIALMSTVASELGMALQNTQQAIPLPWNTP